MARTKRSVQYTADAATIQGYFDEAVELKNAQKSTTSQLSELNTAMQDDGVHAGLLAHYAKIARMKPEKAALWLALEDFYRQALASRLPDPAVATKPEAPTKDAAIPFADRRTAAA